MIMLAGADDFFRGVQSFDAEEYMKYDENTAPPEILSTVTKFGLDSHTNTVIDCILFQKYPNHYYFSQYKLSLAMERDVLGGWYYWDLAQKYLGRTKGTPEQEAFTLWSLFKVHDEDASKMYRNGKWKTDIPNSLTDDIYKDIMTLEISPKSAIGVFSSINRYPKWMVDELSQRHPEIWNSIFSTDANSKYDLMQRVFSFPTPEALMELTESLRIGYKHSDGYPIGERDKGENKKIRDFHSSILPAIYNYGSFEHKVLQRVGEEKLGAGYPFYSKTPQEIISIIDGLFNAKQQGLVEFHDPETKSHYYKDVNNTIQAEMFIVCGVNFKEETLAKLKETVSVYPEDASLSITSSESEIERYSKSTEEAQQYKGNLVLIDEDNRQIHPFGNMYEDYVNFYDSKLENDRYFFSAIEASAASRMIDSSLAPGPQKAQAFKEWFYKELDTAKAREAAGEYLAVENFYIDMSKHAIIRKYTQSAGSFLASMIISGNNPTKEEDYDPDNPPHWSRPLDSDFNATMEIMAAFPPKIIDSMAKASQVWFVLCSGLFSPEVVYETTKRYMTDALKVISAITTRDENDQEFLNTLRAEIRHQTAKAKNDVREGMKSYLAAENGVVKKKVSDFPELMEYCKTFLQRYTDNTEEVFTGRDDDGKRNYKKAYEIAMNKLEELDIYLVDSQKFISHFGAEDLANAGYSPYQMNGFYSPSYGIADNPTIFVFTKGDVTENDMVNAAENLEKFLGIKPEDKTISFSEENTLWHEVSHHLTGVGIDDSSNYQTAGGWITEPTELLAFQYGNLQHMKQRLYAFFNSQFPFDARITAGMNEQIKSELIENFPIEFQGMNREAAMETVGEMLVEYEQSVFESGKKVPREQQIQNLTHMFAKYFMQQYLKSKTQERLEFDQGKKLVTFPNKVIPPEENTMLTLPNTRDEFISNVQKRPDFQQMVNGIKVKVDQFVQGGMRDSISIYLHKNSNVPRQIFTLPDLLMYMFDPPASLSNASEYSKNEIFSDVIPQSMYDFIIDYAKKELSLSVGLPNKKPTVTPEEAEELGGFVADMDQEYGPDWVWMAGAKNMKKTGSFARYLFNFAQAYNRQISIPQEYMEVISDIVEKSRAVGLVPYATGGFVRDLLVGKKSPKDLDIMVDVADTETYMRQIQPFIDEAQRDPMSFIQNNLEGAKKLVRVNSFNLEQSDYRSEFFRITADIDYMDNSKKKPQLISNAPFETSINPSLLLAKQFGRQIPRGEAFGIYAVPTPIGEVEIAYPRTERYEPGSRKPRTEMGNFQEDANRRDFGMNAMFLDLDKYIQGDIEGALHDPTGHGLQDVQEKTIRITDPSAIDTIFQDDPLRILRAIRQAAQHDFKIDSPIVDYIKQNPHLIGVKGDELDSEFWKYDYTPKLSAERVAEEFRKIMSLPNAAQSLKLMKECGLLQFVLKLPVQAEQNWDMDHLNPHHYESIWDHTMTVMSHLQQVVQQHGVKDPQKLFTLNMAALFHDVGKLFKGDKGYQEEFDGEGNVSKRRYFGHPEISTEQTLANLQRLKFSTEEITNISTLVKMHDEVLGLDKVINDPTQLESQLGRLLITMKGAYGKKMNDEIFDLLMLAMADRRAHKEPGNTDDYLVAALQHLQQDENGGLQRIQGRLTPFINGNEIMTLFGSMISKDLRWIGLLNKQLVDLQIDQKITSRNQAFDIVKKLALAAEITGKPAGSWLLSILPILVNPAIAVDKGAVEEVLYSNYRNIKDEGKQVITPLLNGNEILNIVKEVNPDIKPGAWMNTLISNLVRAQMQKRVNSKEEAASFIKQEASKNTLASMTSMFRKIAKDIYPVMKTQPRSNRWNSDDKANEVNLGGGKGQVKDQPKDRPRKSIVLTPNPSSMHGNINPAEPMRDYYASVKSAQLMNSLYPISPEPIPDADPSRLTPGNNNHQNLDQLHDKEYPNYKFKFEIDMDSGRERPENIDKGHRRMLYFYQDEQSGNYMMRAYDRPDKPIKFGNLMSVMDFLRHNEKYRVNLTGYENNITSRMPMFMGE